MTWQNRTRSGSWGHLIFMLILWGLVFLAAFAFVVELPIENDAGIEVDQSQ